MREERGDGGDFFKGRGQIMIWITDEESFMEEERCIFQKVDCLEVWEVG